MAHGMVKGLDKMASGRKLSVWHQRETDSLIVDGLMTAQEARIKGIGDWEPLLVPVYLSAGGDGTLAIQGYRAVVRNDLGLDDPNRTLGIVGDRYEPITNETVADLMDALTNCGARVDTVGTLYGGRRVYMTALLPGSNEVIDDHLAEFIILTTSHDGSVALEAMHSPQRVVCQNTLSMAYSKAKSRVAIRHTANYFNKIEEAARVMESAKVYFAEHAKIMRNLASLKLTMEQARDFTKLIIEGDSTKAKNDRENVLTLFYGGQIGAEQKAVKDTAYGMVNAFTQWIETDRTTRVHNGRDENEARLDSVLFGSGAKLRDKVMAKAVAML